MPESIKQATSTVSELTEARAIQGFLAIIVTVGIMALYVLEREIPSELGSVWIFLIGLYMELPSRVQNTSSSLRS